jgi:tetratricopeptide (TPR) repeat protein
MSRLAGLFVLLFSFAAAGVLYAQSDAYPGPNQAPPGSTNPNVSSSSQTKVDISPPKNDAKDHPDSAEAVADLEADESEGNNGVYPWNPLKANKDLEVGDFYFNLQNYAAALSRYREALRYKPGDAIANYKLGECLEKMHKPKEAVFHYQQYLKILPQGPKSKDAEKSIAKLTKEQEKAEAKAATGKR